MTFLKFYSTWITHNIKNWYLHYLVIFSKLYLLNIWSVVISRSVLMPTVLSYSCDKYPYTLYAKRIHYIPIVLLIYCNMCRIWLECVGAAQVSETFDCYLVSYAHSALWAAIHGCAWGGQLGIPPAPTQYKCKCR